MCAVPEEPFALGVGSADPLSFRRQLVAGLLAAAVVAAAFVLAARAASAALK